MNSELMELVPKYALNKSELDSYKKMCDVDGNRIKELMASEELDEVEASGYICKRVVQHRETMQEDKMLDVLHKAKNIEHLGLIKTKEVVDTDALESALYHGDIPEELVTELNKCFDTKEVVTLRVGSSKKKEKK